MIFYNVNRILNNNNLHEIMYIKLDVRFLEQFQKKCWSEKHKLTRELCEPVWKIGTCNCWAQGRGSTTEGRDRDKETMLFTLEL